MKNLTLNKGMDEIYRAILRWAELNEMGVQENNREKEGFVLKFNKKYRLKQKFSWGLAIFLFFLGAVLATISEEPPGSPGSFILVILPLFIYLISYFLKKKPKEASFRFVARRDGDDVLLKTELTPEALEPAKTELTQLMNKLI